MQVKNKLLQKTKAKQSSNKVYLRKNILYEQGHV